MPEGDGFARALLDWYALARRDLPWRRTRDPYAIWISETMLQQTQVATAIPYFTRWMERFPTAWALAEAPLEDVLKAWQGLGYYARARNLHRAAREIVERHGGRFPTGYDELRALPGVGRYTAGAVGSIALGLDTPLVDANVVRVLCRVFGLRGDPKSAPVQARLWELAAQLIPPGEAGEFNQAMMELGALVCLNPPRCERCPVQALCAAYASGDPSSLPESSPRKAPVLQTDICAAIERDGAFLLIRRPLDGLWGGLWELPRVTAERDETDAAAAARAARTAAGLEVAVEGVLAAIRHGVMNRQVTLRAVACRIAPAATPRAPDGGAVAWVRPEATEDYPLSSPQARLLRLLRGDRQLALF